VDIKKRPPYTLLQDGCTLREAQLILRVGDRLYIKVWGIKNAQINFEQLNRLPNGADTTAIL